MVVELAQLKAAFLKLLKEDVEFRYAVAGLIGMEEILRRLDRHEEELVKIWEELARLREDMNKGFQRHDQLFAEVFKRFEHYDQLFAEILKKLEQHDQLFAEILKRLDRHEEELVRLREDMNKRFEHYDQLFAEVFKRLDRHEERIGRVEEELVRLREDMNRGFQRYDQLFAEVFKRLDKHEEELVRLREDMNKMFAQHEERIGRVEEELARLRAEVERGFRRLDALGARWGVMSEAAFREGLRGAVERELGLKVERWTAYDEEGKVFGFPSEVEVDVAVKDGKVILIEITSHARPYEVSLFKKKADLYAEKEGRRPDRLVIITPYAEEDAKRVAERLGIEIYTGV